MRKFGNPHAGSHQWAPCGPDRPSARLYVDANVPAGLVAFMRTKLQWDVLFVIEHDDLRRARDGEHYRLARDWGRTLLTLDRDYLDDRKFPPGESGGVVVLTAPTESGYEELLDRAWTRCCGSMQAFRSKDESCTSTSTGGVARLEARRVQEA